MSCFLNTTKRAEPVLFINIQYKCNGLDQHAKRNTQQALVNRKQINQIKSDEFTSLDDFRSANQTVDHSRGVF